MPQNSAINLTRQWIESFIIPLNICPFAKREFQNNRIRYQCLSGQNLEDHLFNLISECRYLDQHPETETTLLIYPEAFTHFDAFLDFLSLAEQLLYQHGFEGIYQLASFHPHYCFEGSDDNDPANYTNRSPYPMLHLIREASIEKALKHYPSDPESIPENNIHLLRKMGLDTLTALLSQLQQR
ncbi:DUF1415 domain-containing protein [methane-oxidizing endosymbiont of Gigantopelta aegis]|uniref:DUF1415 domain-containing protein n=1 Tax=methane-oxidizing endosymbiont of Gigantopelta aegis TaxID=2794938 RepID=UPI0018DD1FC0|nr:DUF1415 domain-containing protein [methane-oxidizing endosymbiont of Gigantopelta aegis]